MWDAEACRRAIGPSRSREHVSTHARTCCGRLSVIEDIERGCGNLIQGENWLSPPGEHCWSTTTCPNFPAKLRPGGGPNMAHLGAFKNMFEEIGDAAGGAPAQMVSVSHRFSCWFGCTEHPPHALLVALRGPWIARQLLLLRISPQR